jgi:excisionase family DNA binding protein
MHTKQHAVSGSGLPRRTYTLQETGHITGLGQSTINLLVRDGKLKTCKVGKRRLVFAESIDELLKGGAT